MSALSHKIYDITDGGIRLFVRATSAAAKNEISGIWAGADGKQWLVVKVTAAPDKGRANAAIVKLLAKHLGLPKSTFSIMSGKTSRQKTISITGDCDQLVAMADNLTGEFK